jgi:hypothetical protein
MSSGRIDKTRIHRDTEDRIMIEPTSFRIVTGLALTLILLGCHSTPDAPAPRRQTQPPPPPPDNTNRMRYAKASDGVPEEQAWIRGTEKAAGRIRVSRNVVNHAQPLLHIQSEPLVEGTSSPVMRVASRRPRAKALNSASAI